MAQTLETIIAINATIGNGFSEIGATLTALGSQIDGISEKLIGFGKDSLKTYEDYEKNMAEARVALATVYGKDTKELDQVMKSLDESAREWASTTIFHTDDVGNAITEAARAGWDYNMIMSGIPVAMQLAQAGSIDLSDAIYYITEAAKAGGIAFEDLGSFVDMWAYTANSSNGSIETFGDTMLRLGSVMQFAGSREELLSLIAIMHDTGTEGSTAATLLRTAMMNILAPSGTAGAVLEQLGATEEEIESIRQDASKLEALEILGEHGFSAFDDKGQAKPILETFRDLRDALADIAGGYDLIDKNETTLGVLGTIFGKRGITGALNIMNMLEHAEDLQQQLLNGDAAGYGEYAAGTMMDTLYGSIETWESKVENLELRTGEALAAQVQPVLETVGGIADSIANLDTGTFNALVSGLEIIAAAGPGLIAAGGAFRLIGYALTPAGGTGLGLTALVAAAAAINELEEADFAAQFGDLELDSSQIQNYVQKLGDDFKSAYANVDEFSRALNEAVEQYQTTSSSFKENLISDMLTGVEIKEGSEEYNKLVNMGSQMQTAIEQGIRNGYGATMESVTQTFGDSADEIDNGVWGQIISVLEQGMEQELGEARSLGQRLRDAMMEAFKDGRLNGDEIANIQSIIDEQNELLARQQDREHYLERQRILRNAQTLGLDAIREASDQVEKERDAEWETLMDRQTADYYDVATWYDQAIKNGLEIPEIEKGANGQYYATGNYKVATEADKEIGLAELAQRQEAERYRWSTNFNDFIMGLWTEGITSSNLSGTWTALENLAQSVQDNGGVITLAESNAYDEASNPEATAQTVRYLEDMIGSLGGYNRLQEYADYYAEQGDMDTAQQYRLLMTMSDIFSTSGMAYPQIGPVYSQDQEMRTQGEIERARNDIQNMRADLASLQGSGHLGLPAGYSDSSAQEIEADIVVRQNELANLYARNGIEIPVTPYVEGTDAVESLRDQGVQVQVEGDTQQLQATIDGADGQTLMTYVNGDASNLSMSIQDQNGLTLRENVTGDASSLSSIISSYDGRTITVNIRGNNMIGSIGGLKAHATGGRATEASVFAEAGPEWAIPEEHSERTAELLAAASAASGFTWPDIISRFGGFNANPGHVPTTLVYSPTIYAQDADGVEEKLIEDKARLDKWYAEKQMLDQMEVYS